MGRKWRALHTAKCRFVSWFTILGHRMAWPTGWMERDREFFLYCLYSITQFEQSLCTFMLCCCYSNQSQTEKVERLLHTRRILFFFLPQSQTSIRNSRCWLGDGSISKRGKGWAGFWVASVVSDGAAATSKVPQTVAPMHWNEWFYISLLIRHGFFQSVRRWTSNRAQSRWNL